MARFAVRMSLEDGKPDIVFVHLEDTVTSETSLCRAWWEEWITAFGTEEVLLVIGAFAQLIVVQCNENFIHNGSLTVVTSWGVNIVVVKMAVRPTTVLVRTKILQQLTADATSETLRVPMPLHFHSPSNDFPTTAATDQVVDTTSDNRGKLL